MNDPKGYVDVDQIWVLGGGVIFVASLSNSLGSPTPVSPLFLCGFKLSGCLTFGI